MKIKENPDKEVVQTIRQGLIMTGGWVIHEIIREYEQGGR
jgi:hypothetical protein